MSFTQRVRDHGHGAVNQGSVTQSKVAAGAQIWEGQSGHRLIATGQDTSGVPHRNSCAADQTACRPLPHSRFTLEIRRGVGQAGS
jgi:hypothetical protein